MTVGPQLTMYYRAVNGYPNNANRLINNNTKKKNILYDGWGDFSRFGTQHLNKDTFRHNLG